MLSIFSIYFSAAAEEISMPGNIGIRFAVRFDEDLRAYLHQIPFGYDIAVEMGQFVQYSWPGDAAEASKSMSAEMQISSQLGVVWTAY